MTARPPIVNLAAYTLRKRTIAWVACVLLLVGGYISYQGLGRFEDPEFVIRQAVVITPYPGALPSQVAEEVTDVIEGAVQQLQELKEVASVSRMGSSLVKVEIDMRFARSKDDLEQVWDKLRRKVADAQRRLPPGAGPSVVNDDFGDVYALFFAVTGDGYRLEQIRDYVDALQRELLLVSGVARVAMLGAPQEAIFVEIAAAKAAQLGVPLDQIYQALRQQNVISAAGDLLIGQQRIQLSPAGQVDSVAAIGNIVLASRGGEQVIFLKDVATITRDVVEPPQALVRYDGKPAVGLGVSQVAGGNVVEMGEAVRERLAALESLRPVGMELNVISYQSDSVRAAVDGFVANLAAAVVIVVLVLVVFMGLRSGLIVGMILLLTVAGTLIAMYLGDIAMQRISLGALIIALGMLVDNAIVVTDGILVRLQRGEDAAKAAVEVVEATKWPLLGGTAVGILAFSAIGLSPTDMGEYAGSLFWVILYSMLLSWLFAVTLTPLFCVSFLKVKPAAGGAVEHPILRRYRGLLRTALRHRALTGAMLLVMLGGAIFGFGFVAPGFMPESARPQFVVAYLFLLVYPFTKRFTVLSHLVLGMTDGLATLGAWAAVRQSLFTPADLPAWVLFAAVSLWIAGFDMIYACQDIDFDRQEGLYSAPARYGPAVALRLSSICHALTTLLLVALGLLMNLGWAYALGVLLTAGLLAYEHHLVRPTDFSRLNTAFFNINSVISVVLLLTTMTALLIA